MLSLERTRTFILARFCYNLFILETEKFALKNMLIVKPDQIPERSGNDRSPVRGINAVLKTYAQSFKRLKEARKGFLPITMRFE